jgi:hypothetical protein
MQRGCDQTGMRVSRLQDSSAARQAVAGEDHIIYRAEAAGGIAIHNQTQLVTDADHNQGAQWQTISGMGACVLRAQRL